jgi:hypothetical protein
MKEQVMVEQLKSVLEQILADSDLHARWLNTFSYLEYVGFRKIVKSQPAENVTADLLAHALEEGRHAFLLKRAAIKVGGPSYDRYIESTFLAGNAARSYFQCVDQFCHASLERDKFAVDKASLNYLYVTWLVEVRALEVYSLYQQLAVQCGMSFGLKGLLAEEERHLSAVESELALRDPKFAERADEYRRVEQHLYQTYLANLAQEVTQFSSVSPSV